MGILLKSENPVGQDLARIVSVEILPEKGWSILQITAFFPGIGEIPLLADCSFAGAFLIPFSNRMTLPSGSEVIHGFLSEEIVTITLESSEEAKGFLNAQDFKGKWPSKAKLHFNTTLRDGKLELSVIAQNSGSEVLPMGIGWHPYFQLLEKTVRLKIPAKNRLEVDDYQHVFPTGKKNPLVGTPYDFSSAEGKELSDLYLDDCFVDFFTEGNDLAPHIEMIYSHFGMRMTLHSPEIKAIQIYAPLTENCLALEPQYNFADALNTKTWPNRTESGMVYLQPNESTEYRITLEVFECSTRI